jgi:crotonobetaine/carnitine-CoA ligase
VPSPLGEDDIKAVIVLREGQTADAEALFAFFRDNLPFYAMPRYVELTDALPKTAVGRVRKHELRERGVTAADIDFEALGLSVAREERRKVS